MNSLHGVIVPLITPLTDGLLLDEEGLRRLLRRCIAGGVHGLFAGGTAGLGPLLPDAMWRRMMTVALEEVGGRLPLLAGVMETSTPRAVERIRWLEREGYEAYVLTPSFYLTLHTPEEFLAHFGACRDASAMAMVVYNIPPCTGSCIPLATMLEMNRRGWIDCVKDSSADPVYFHALCEQGRERGLKVFLGSRPDFAWLRACGAAGIVPVPANVEPEALARAWERSANGGDPAWRPLQARTDQLWDALVDGFDFLSGSTYMLGRLGIGSGRMMPPLQPASAARRARIDALGIVD